MTHTSDQRPGTVERALIGCVYRTIFIGAMMALSGCATDSEKPQKTVQQEIRPAKPESVTDDVRQSANAAVKPVRTPVIIAGTGVLVAPDQAVRSTPAVRAGVSEDAFQLSFIDTDIATVVSSVIGEGLGLPYSVDPQVKGTMTLQAERPLAREDVLPSLEAALRVQEAALVNINGVYNVVPIKDAPRRVSGLRGPADRTRAGFAIRIVPLRYISVVDMEKILRPLAPEGAILRIDEGRNLLLLAGTSQELTTMLDAVGTFDVDWLAGMSFGLFGLEYGEPKAVAYELEKIFADPKSPIFGVVRVVPLDRLNSLMIVTPQAEYLKKIETWIKQLDIGVATPGRRVYVYDVQNGRATDLARALNQILSLSSGGSPGDGAVTLNTSSDSYGSSTRGAGSVSDALRSGVLPSGASSSRGASPEDSNFAERRAGSLFTATGSGADSLHIVPNTETNALLVWATPSEFALVEGAVKRLDVQPIQVLIEASLAEVTLSDELRFGLQWSYASDQGPVVLSEAGSGAISPQFPGLSFLYRGRQDIRAVLNTLESLTDVKVISSPKLLVLNNHEAQLQVGDQVPVVTQSSISTVGENSPIVNAVEMRDTGVILRVTPRANKNGLVLLDIGQEVSDVIATTTSEINSPTIQQRKITSTVAVHDGETIALGGLIRDTNSKSRGGVPFLRRIPVVGTLFGSTDTNKRRTELIILITPRVVRSSDEAADMMDELREQFRDLRKTFSQLQGAPRQTKRNRETENEVPLSTPAAAPTP